MKYSPQLRIRLISLGLLLIAAVLTGRLFYIQVMYGETYRDLATRQYASGGEERYDRGEIFFRTKEGTPVSAATQKDGYVLAIHPTSVEEPDALYEALDPYIEMPQDEFLARAGKEHDPYEELDDRVTAEVAERIQGLDLEGVGVYPARWRFYPGDGQAAHVLGFVGFKEEDYGGRYGLERYYEDVLAREDSGPSENFFVEVFGGIEKIFAEEEVADEADLILTIEPEVQGFVENELGKLAAKYSTENAGAIVIDPNTGEIYAMAAYPDFNPNRYYEEEDILVFSNPLVEDIYEMGSIVKPLTIAAALDADVLDESDTYVDKGTLVIDGERISNYDGMARGEVPIQEILNQSLNTGAVHAMQQLGRSRFREYMYDFGLGEKTLIDLPNEVRGLVSNLESNREIEYATASFGQGVAVTPIAMVRALSALANGGMLVRPHVVVAFEHAGLPDREVHTEEQGRVLKESTSERISRMLTEVVDEALAGGDEALPQYRIAAKTGTAQISKEEGGGYYADRFLHSFFGYFPAYDPEFLVFFYAVDPKDVRYASETLTYPFMETAKFLINYYEIPPDRLP